METEKTLKRLEQIYARRRDIEAARKASLDQKVFQHQKTIAELDVKRVDTKKSHISEIEVLLNQAKTARHFGTLSAALMASKVNHLNTMTYLRYDTLQEHERLEKTQDEANNQNNEARIAAQRSEKMKLLLAKELSQQDEAREAKEEEEAAEAQACIRTRHA